MRECWIGDVADFAKFGVLRRLAGKSLKLGVLWYLTRHGPSNSPLVGYLADRQGHSSCDPELFGILNALHARRSTGLSVADLEGAGILAAESSFFGEPLETTVLERRLRAKARSAWFDRALKATSSSELVFFDPDTGLSPSGTVATRSRGEEYARVEEVQTVLARGQSAVVVQFGAPGNFEKEPLIARSRLALLREAARERKQPDPWGLWWKEGHKVGLLVAPCAAHAPMLRERAKTMLEDSAWSQRLTAL